MGAAIKNIAVLLTGDANMTWPGFAIGSTLHCDLDCRDPSDESSPLDLSNLAVTVSLSAFVAGIPSAPVLVFADATIVNASEGICFVEFDAADTASLDPDIYAVDAWAESTDGKRLQLGYGSIQLSAAVRGG